MAQTTNKTSQTPKALSISVSLDGLSFCVLSFGEVNQLKSVTFERQLNPTETLERLQKLLASADILSKTFEAVSLTIANNLFTVVPSALFKEDQLTSYLKFSVKLLKTDFAAFDSIKGFNCNTVYIPFTNINNFIFDQFGDFTYKHVNTVFSEAILQQNYDEGVFVNVEASNFNLVAIKDGKLMLSNSFSYDTKEDFIYYILFSYEQLEFDREQIPLYLCGDVVPKSELYEMAYTYIKTIEMFNYKGYQTEKDLGIDAHKHVILRQALV